MRFLRNIAVIAGLSSPAALAEEPRETTQTEISDLSKEMDAVWAELVGAAEVKLAARPSCAILEDQFDMSKQESKFERPFDETEVEAEIESLLQWFQEAYGIEVFFGTEETRIGHDFLICPFQGNALMKLNYLINLKAQVLKYPPEFLKKIDLKQIRYVQRIYDPEDGKQLTGTAFHEDPYLNLTKNTPFHHEVFHKTDNLLNGGGDLNPINIDWGQLDPNDKRYRSLDEEQADMASFLFQQDNRRIQRKHLRPIRAHEGSSSQLEHVEFWLKIASNGAFDEQYWEDLRRGRIDEGYWISL